MKWFRSSRLFVIVPAACIAAAALVLTLGVRHLQIRAASTSLINYGSFRNWLQNTEAGSAVESALYRLMALPTGYVLYLRPPAESGPQLDKLLTSPAPDAALYSLGALQDEQALDFPAAERDWKLWAAHAPDHAAAELDLAAFYGRRLRPQDEIAALTEVGRAPSPAAEKFMRAGEQRSWLAFEHMLTIVQEDGLKSETAIATYQQWIIRYPAETAVYSRYFDYLLAQKRFDDASALIAQYQRAFPQDTIFPVKAAATLAYRRGSLSDGLAVYDKDFQPLWPAELIQDYYGLLTQTHSLSAFLDRTRATLEANPDDLDAAARLFYAYQQQGRLDAARQVIVAYRQSKESRGARWTAPELYTFARLLQGAQDGPEAARYYYALHNSAGMPDAQQRAIAGLIEILLDAPEQPMRLGAGNLSMYRDIATMDQGPGYLNGILSLLLNTTNPQSEYATEDQLASPYFHRAAAAGLLDTYESRFPNAPERSSLRARLIRAYAVYGENDAVIRAGTDFLTRFPKAPERVEIALAVADADARTDRTQDEFTMYDRLLRELAARAEGVPLGDRTQKYSQPVENQSGPQTNPASSPIDQSSDAGDESPAPDASAAEQNALATQTATLSALTVRSPQYEQVLDRYIARMVALDQLPQALTVLRGEVDHDPDDPGIYQKLADFLDQNRLGEHEEEVYRRAIQQFDDRGWYAKLARYYVRKKRNADYASLTAQVAKIFSGTELESYFRSAPAPGAQLSLQVNLYAHQRFPHDLSFTTRLLALYHQHDTYNEAAWQKLISEHWFESESLRREFFEYLARTGNLDKALGSLREKNTEIGKGDWTALTAGNPAAAGFLVEAQLWQSHFEEAAPAAGALAAAYPADAGLGRQASSLYRSLAYFQPSDTAKAVAIEKRLLDADPGNLDTMARIGDIYADHARFAEAAPYWLRMAQVHPGEASGYLQSATVFWDYFDFDNALSQIEKARQALANPALFSYEAGAIYENQRYYPRAIAEYVRGSVTDAADQQCRNRLLALARRPAMRQAIADATASLGAEVSPTMAEISLRIDILNALERRDDAAVALDSALSRSSSFDVLESIEQLARQQSFVRVQQHAIERQIAITTDPVRRMELRYNLVHFYEDNGQNDAAQREIDALYQENPKILGVVRAAVDFDWAHNRRAQAVAVLQQASGGAYPELGNKFRFEAAGKLTELGQYDQARAILTDLLKNSTHDAAYLAAAADTYARAGDDAGLRDFYQAQIASLKDAAMEPADKIAAIATLRRGLIPALIRLKDPAGAADQYIELINAYPEDESVTTEAALFAMRYGQEQKVTTFYARTVAASPRDSRWMIVLARIETTLEDYPAAIDAYTKAIAIRPDRVDLYTARAALDEKLQRYDQAATDYDMLYHLSYKDPSWLQKEAETRLRQGKPDQAIAALESALVGVKNPKAEDYFAAARQFESWSLLQPALEMSEKGAAIASDDLLADYANQAGAATYIRILVRLRKPEVALSKVDDALAAAGKLPSVAATFAHVEEAGVGSVSAKEWREQQRQTRLSVARAGFLGALREMTATAQTYDTPEETQAFVELLRTSAAKASDDDLKQLYLPAVESSSYPTLEAEWKWRLASTPQNEQMWSSWAQLQRQRLLLASAGKQLEAFAQTTSTGMSNAVYSTAADFYRDAGEAPDELRALRKMSVLNADQRERYFALTLSLAPQTYSGLARSESEDFRDAAAQYAILHAPAALALETVAARGAGLQPVWSHGYTALAGYFLRQQNDGTEGAFRAALGGGTIAERLAAHVDRNQQLAGDLWFYYGARYGEYLSLGNSQSAEDYLPATVEQQPESAGAYVELAEWYAEQGSPAQALEQYDYALQLTPDSPTIYDSNALLLLRLGRKPEAVAAWQHAVSLLMRQVDLKRVPDSFWPDFTRIVGDHSARFGFASVRPQVDAMLRVYIKRNGSYMTEPLLRAVFKADADANDAVSWILDLSAVGNPPESVLESIVDTSWLPIAQKPRVYARLVDLARDRVTSSEGEARTQAQIRVRQLQAQWIDALAKAGNYAEADLQLAAIPADEKRQSPGQWLPIELTLAAHDGTLKSLVETWRRDPASAPPVDILRNSSNGLDTAAKNVVLSYVYSSAIDAHDLSATNFLGLAEIDIANGDLPGAASLLNRLVLVSTDTVSDLDAAAELLIRTGHDAEALPFFDKLTSAVPWQPAYRVRLDEARLKSKQDEGAALRELADLAASQSAAYAVRAQAAPLLAGRNQAASFGSVELNLLARGSVPPPEARKPFFITARMASAKAASPPQRVTLLKEVIAAAPRDDDARIQLVEAAIAAKDAHLAISAAKPLLGENVLVTVTYGQGPPAESEDAQPDDSADGAQMSGGAESFNQLPDTVQSAILSGIAESYRRIDEPESAFALLRYAARTEPDAARKKAILAEIAALRRQLSRVAANAARAPQIHSALDQNHPVRPRLPLAQQGRQP